MPDAPPGSDLRTERVFGPKWEYHLPNRSKYSVNLTVVNSKYLHLVKGWLDSTLRFSYPDGDLGEYQVPDSLDKWVHLGLGNLHHQGKRDV